MSKPSFEIYYDYLLTFTKIPYKWGGSNPISGLDCSGFAQEAAAVLGIDPAGDQTASELFEAYRKGGEICLAKDFVRGAPHRAVKLGAFAFYGSALDHITHITCVLNESLAIGANGGGSKVVDRASADAQDAFIKIRPIDYRKDLLAVVYPNYQAWTSPVV